MVIPEVEVVDGLSTETVDELKSRMRSTLKFSDQSNGTTTTTTAAAGTSSVGVPQAPETTTLETTSMEEQLRIITKPS